MIEDVLPEGWAEAPLSSLAIRITKGSTPTSYGHKFQCTGIRFVKVENVHEGRIEHSSIRDFISAEAHAEQGRSQLQEGDILFSIAGTIGETCIVSPDDLPANTNQALAIIRGTSHALNARFAQLVLSSAAAQRAAEDRARGGGMDNVSLADVGGFLIVVPPLAEQRRIVERVEALLTQVDAARARLTKLPTILRRFRQSILAAASSGRLTEDWRNTHSPKDTGAMVAERLRRLHEPAGAARRGNAAEPSDEAHDFDGADLPETWTVCELLWLCEPSRPITYGILKPGPDQRDGVPYVRVADFPGNRLRLAGMRRTSRAIAEAYKRSTLGQGDLLLSIRGTFGRVCRVPRELDGANITQDTARLSIHKSVDPEYILAWLQSPSLQDRLGRAAKGAAVRGVNIGDIRALQAALPPLEEQHEIVRRLDALFRLADAVGARVAEATARAERLTQAILARAFRGELVPTEAELARREGRAYEPASVLLARIRAEQVAAGHRGRRARVRRPTSAIGGKAPVS